MYKVLCMTGLLMCGSAFFTGYKVGGCCKEPGNMVTGGAICSESSMTVWSTTWCISCILQSPSALVTQWTHLHSIIQLLMFTSPKQRCHLGYICSSWSGLGALDRCQICSELRKCAQSFWFSAFVLLEGAQLSLLLYMFCSIRLGLHSKLYTIVHVRFSSAVLFDDGEKRDLILYFCATDSTHSTDSDMIRFLFHVSPILH